MTLIKDQLLKALRYVARHNPRRTGRDGLADTATDGGVVPCGQIKHKSPFEKHV